MILKRISIINYKNIKSANIALSDKINCFIGHNGEGKTNFLDAVYYLSFCRSAYNAIDAQVVCHDTDFMVVEGEYDNGEENGMMVSCTMKRGMKKHFKRDRKEYKRLSDHIGLIPVIMISPADTQLIEGGSEERRRLMDMVIAQYDRSYIDALNNYNKALQQRNALLKMEEEPDAALMDIWEREMAHNGELLYQKRNAFVEALAPVFQEIYELISGGKEKVSMHYVSHCQRGPLLEVIQRDRAKDRAVGYSLHGAHRDDLELFLAGYPVKREGSQGQNKTFVIALKLAQFDFLKHTHALTEGQWTPVATTPLLLLDDIFDKLDASRVERIVNLVSADSYGQIFVTDTNRDHLDHILRAGHSNYKLFEVSGGDVTEISQ